MDVHGHRNTLSDDVAEGRSNFLHRCEDLPRPRFGEGGGRQPAPSSSTSSALKCMNRSFRLSLLDVDYRGSMDQRWVEKYLDLKYFFKYLDLYSITFESI